MENKWMVSGSDMWLLNEAVTVLDLMNKFKVAYWLRKRYLRLWDDKLTECINILKSHSNVPVFLSRCDTYQSMRQRMEDRETIFDENHVQRLIYGLDGFTRLCCRQLNYTDIGALFPVMLSINGDIVLEIERIGGLKPAYGITHNSVPEAVKRMYGVMRIFQRAVAETMQHPGCWSDPPIFDFESDIDITVRPV